MLCQEIQHLRTQEGDGRRDFWALESYPPNPSRGIEAQRIADIIFQLETASLDLFLDSRFTII
jgi:hypothetical protein